jgi:hypothetical protein
MATTIIISTRVKPAWRTVRIDFIVGTSRDATAATDVFGIIGELARHCQSRGLRRLGESRADAKSGQTWRNSAPTALKRIKA